MANAASNGNSLACYGCVDFANNERTLAYHKWACAEGMYGDCRPDILSLCSCPDDSPAEPFTNPIDDEVCWYDSAVPESAEFLGVIILNNPVKNSTASREVTDAFLKGSILNRLKLKGRPFVFQVLLLATSCEGMNYGEEWLRSLLEDAPCQSDAGTRCESCFGRRMGIRVHCPDGVTTDNGLHEWFDVGLVDGMAETEDAGARRQCCCIMKEFTFTMHSASPFSHSSEPTSICDQEVDPESFTHCFNWLTDCFDCCETEGCDRCKDDPICSCFPFTIPEPALPQDPCQGCEPLARIVQCCCTDDLPAIYTTTFKIDIYSGVDITNEAFLDAGMRDFRLRIFQNVKGLPCITDDESYEMWCNEVPCVELATTYIPYDSTLTIDGRTERVTLTCDGVCRPYDHVVSNTLGSLWPLESRCVPLMVCAEFSYYTSQLMPAGPGVRPSSVSVDSYLRFRN